MDVVLGKGDFDAFYLSRFSNVPILNRDLYEKNGIPLEIQEIYSTFRSYGKLVFFAPENNGYLSSFFKNIVDWLSLIEVNFLRGLEVLLVSVSTTKRDVRNMEDSVSKTFALFSPKKFMFLNFKNYGSGEDQKNLFILMDMILRN